jgi:hypothetical protein
MLLFQRGGYSPKRGWHVLHNVLLGLWATNIIDQAHHVWTRDEWHVDDGMSILYSIGVCRGYGRNVIPYGYNTQQIMQRIGVQK